eukprot:UN20295
MISKTSHRLTKIRIYIYD